MKNVSLVHLCQDQMWTQGAYNLFEKAFPKKNLYILVKEDIIKPVKYITYINSLIITTNQKDTIVYELLEKASIVVLHGLNFHHAKVASGLLPQKKILWLSVGSEIYNNQYIYKDKVIGSKTDELRRQIRRQFYLKENLKKILIYVKKGKIWRGSNESNKFIAQIAKNIDYFGAFYEGRLEMLKRINAINDNARFQRFCYYPLEHIVNPNEDISSLGDNILLGNSATYTNNHLEAIDILANLPLGSRKIYTPLSYGINQYAKKVINYGKKKLGNNFSPLTSVLPLSEYNVLIQSCGIVIMNHYRDQGAGNIFSTLFRGSKLFMSRRSSIYQYLKHKGCHVFSIEEEMKATNDDVFKLLKNEQIEHNRNTLKEQISEEVLVDSLKAGICEYLEINNFLV